ncbi:hypothetical protein DYB32_002258 [Aphanomyces invadans]|uniref:THIF-type NAD/FAD binding fold domain-containing protein n=1 Tax=Aphanomyces invadans TaxID=157072 RepID=A0A418B3R5_9STRA|nr:hypothetical protein DYB32_002258 [Aphanomyces invadans]
MSAKLLLLNAGPTGSEILKNVVLPGVGSFEIVDDHVVSESDLGNNFFVKTEDVNRPRAQVVTEWMLEMNPDVRGAYNITSPAELIDHGNLSFRQVTFAEKHDFKQLIRSQCHGSFGQEVNFVEAYDNAFKAYSLPKVIARSHGTHALLLAQDGIPDEVLDVLHHAKSVNVTSTTSSFWFIARALAEFVDKHGALPLSGHVPDMTAFSHTYIALQKIYVNKAALDCDEIFATSAALLKVAGADSARWADNVVGAPPHTPPYRITRDDVAEYCKHASSIRVSSSVLPLGPSNDHVSLAGANEVVGGRSAASKFKRAQWLVDKARSMATHSLESFPAEWITLDHGIETCRNSEVEIHNIAAILGGVGAQEAVKV